MPRYFILSPLSLSAWCDLKGKSLPYGLLIYYTKYSPNTIVPIYRIIKLVASKIKQAPSPDPLRYLTLSLIP